MTATAPSAPGPLALVGSGEFLPQMVEIDRWMLTRRAPRVAIIPTAAGQEGDTSIDQWVKLGVDHYTAMGVEPVPVRVVSRADADDPRYADLLASVGLIYLSGGSPGYVARTLRGSVVGEAIRTAWLNGTALAGCSAGAMVMTDQVPDVKRRSGQMERALGIVPDITLIPHFDQMHRWDPNFMERARGQIRPGSVLIGVDEDTALVGGPVEWTVMGRQHVTVFGSGGEQREYSAGDQVTWAAGRRDA